MDIARRRVRPCASAPGRRQHEPQPAKPIQDDHPAGCRRRGPPAPGGPSGSALRWANRSSPVVTGFRHRAAAACAGRAMAAAKAPRQQPAHHRAARRRLPTTTLFGFQLRRHYAAFDYVLITAPDAPYKNVAELVERARRTGTVSVPRAWAPATIWLRRCSASSQADLSGIPYRGGSRSPHPSRRAMAGRTDSCSTWVGLNGARSRKEARSRPSASAASSAMRCCPGVPPIADNVPGYESGWFALIGPARLPPAIVQRLGGTQPHRASAFANSSRRSATGSFARDAGRCGKAPTEAETSSGAR